MAITSEDLFTAIKTIVDKQIDKVHYDKTIVCTIEDNSRASKGEYIVSDGSTSFTAYSEKTNYTLGANVYVTIPQGNYENKKLIIGKYLGDSNTPYTYIPPTENYVDMTGNILLESDNIYRLLANDVDNNGKPTQTNAIISLTDLSLIGYDRLGLSAEFQTLLGSYEILNGHYGLKLELTGVRNDGQSGKEVLYLSTDDMFGNPYNFVGATKQEKVFDISNYSEIQDINIYFYQSADFIDNNNEYIKYKIPGTDQKLIENLLVSNIQLNAGYDYSSFDKETILLYTLNSKIFSAEDSKRNLQVRFIQLNEQGTYSQMNEIPYMVEGDEVPKAPAGQEDSYEKVQELQAQLSNLENERNVAIEALNEEDYANDELYVEAITNLIDGYAEKKIELQREIAASLGQYIIHWYQWDLAPDVSDEIAGPFWKEIYPQSAYNCDVELRGTAKAHERFKVIIEVNVAADGDTIQKRYIESRILEFTNENGSVETNLAVDLVSGLTLGTNDDYNGIYAIYGGDGKLMNQVDAMKDRYVTVSYQSLVTGLTEFDGAESIMWQVPGNNTMIIIPEEQEGLTITQDPLTKVITLQGNINTSEDDTDVIGENNIRGAKLKFRISSIYSQINTNNTIKCLITRQGFQYAAQMTMHFAPAGTNGTDYTLVLEIDNNQEYTAIPINQVGDFPGLRVVAQLQDYENKPIDGEIALSFENDSGLYFPDSTIGRQKNITIHAGDTALISKNGEVSRHGMVVATAYVWVANRTAEAEENEEEEVATRQIMLTAYLPLSYAENGYTTDLIEGPIRIIYDGGGSNPTYTKLPYNLYTSGIIRTEKIDWSIHCENEGEERYIGKITDGLYTPPVMLVADLGPTWVEGKVNGNLIWSQRVLLQVNRFGSSMLNRWDGSLTIDEENNQILSSIIGAGSKDSENRFTGVIMGDIGKDIKNAKTGLYGYNAGQQAFSFLADGTATIGQSGKGALKFDGNKGTINAQNYLKDEAGMLLDFDDAEFLTKLVKIRGQARSKSNVLEIDGFELDDNDNEMNEVHPLMRVGNKNYFLQSANWNGDSGIDGRGFKLDLGKNKILGYNTKLEFFNTIQNDSNTIDYLPSGNEIAGSLNYYYGEVITQEQYNTLNNNSRWQKTIEGVITYFELKQHIIYYAKGYENIINDALKNNGNNLTFNENTKNPDLSEFASLDLSQQSINWDILENSVENGAGQLLIDSGAKTYPVELSSSLSKKIFRLGWDGSLQATSGRIGNWIINSDSLTTNGGKIGMAGWTQQGGPIFWSGFKSLNNGLPVSGWTDQVGFGVDSNGNLYSNKGKIGGWGIEPDKLVGGDAYNQIENGKYYYYYEDNEKGEYYWDGSRYIKITDTTYSGTKFARVESTQTVTLDSKNGIISAKTFSGYLDGKAKSAGSAGYLSSYPTYSGRELSVVTSIGKTTYTTRTIYYYGNAPGSGVSHAHGIGTGSGTCLDGLTKIYMKSGQTKYIKDIKQGDIVLSYNFDTKNYEYNVVVSNKKYNSKKMLQITLLNGIILKITPGHPLYTLDGWKSLDKFDSLLHHLVKVKELSQKDELFGFYKNYFIKDIKYLPINNYECYNLTVKNTHNYFAEGVLVHNTPENEKN